MKRFFVCLLVLALFALSGCGSRGAEGSGGSEEATGVSSSGSISTDATAAVSGVPDDASALFGSYDWTVTGLLGGSDAVLPDSLKTNVEDSPLQFYWMRAAVLSGDIGYDLTGLLGSPVRIEIYALDGALPEKYPFPAFQSIRGILYRGEDGAIAGALVDSGRHAGNSVSLKIDDVEDITGLSLSDYWSQNYYDPGDPVNAAAEQRTAEDVVRRYLQSVATGDSAAQLSTLSVQGKLQSLFSNLDDSLPYNQTPELYTYLSSVEILSLRPYDADSGEGMTGYAAEIDGKTNESGKMTLGDGGKMTRFILVGEENGSLRVFGDGTGP